MTDALPSLLESSPASATEGGRKVSKTTLYVSGLPRSVTEDMLRELFSVTGQVQSVKILFDKNRPNFNYAFVEYDSTQSAEMAKHTLSGRLINNAEISINWAYQLQLTKAADCFNLFVGDLLPEIKDDGLHAAFCRFPLLVLAHVMWDMQTGRLRGYGFVSFANQQDAEAALQTMPGEWLGGRQIRLNWALHKQQPVKHPGPAAGLTPAQTYEYVFRQTPAWQTTVYIGNLPQLLSQADLVPLLQNYGYIVDLKFHPDKGCAFVKYDTHEGATYAIMQLAGYALNGRVLKSGWGKDTRGVAMQYQGYRWGV